MTRTIRTAFVTEDGEQRRADIAKLFRGQGFDIRENYNKGLISFSCCECGEPLTISYNKNTVYLKHYQNSTSCLLKDDKADEELIRAINQVNLYRESPRHLELKEKLIKKLQQSEDVSNIESKQYQFYEKERRKPDVFCHYKEYKIAFEVQLSKLSQKYIFYRQEFYNNLGIYLIWIIDDFMKNSQNHTDKDLKYLEENQNLFELNEDLDDERIFICHYKKPRIWYSREVRNYWKKSKIGLNDLTFRRRNYTAFYYDYFDSKIRLTYELEEILEAKRREERRIYRQREIRNAEIKRLSKEVDKLEDKISSQKSTLRYSRREKSWTDTIINSKQEILKKPREAIQNLLNDERDRKLSDFKNFNEAIKSTIQNIREVKYSVNRIQSNIRIVSDKIKSINDLKIFKAYGLEFRLLNPEEHEKFITDNSRKIVYAYTTNIKSGNISFIKADSKNPLKKMLRNPKKYSFLFNFNTILKNYQKKISDYKKEIWELEIKREELEIQLTSFLVDWCKEKIELNEIERIRINQEIENHELELNKMKSNLDDLKLEKFVLCEKNEEY